MKAKLRKRVEKSRVNIELAPKGMKYYSVKLCCGCCIGYLYFLNDENALDALDKAGLGSIQPITDDSGRSYNNVDTFYGIRSLSEEEYIKEMLEYT